MYGATSRYNGFMYIVFVDVASEKRTVNIHTELYSYKTYAFVVAKNDVGDRLVNTELDIVVFYIK